MDTTELVKHIAETITEGEVKVECTPDRRGAILKLHPTQNIPILIGKRGQTIDALRVIARALGYNGKHGVQIIVNEQKNT